MGAVSSTGNNTNQEKFNLTWHTYADHFREMLQNMMSSDELTDITLISEDKKRFKAHKVVLSACSPLFQSIICESDLSSPFIYLRGIQSLEIESILQFIYLGEATFYQERMNEFINVARSLEVKEIIKDIFPENEQLKNVDNKSELPSMEIIPEQIIENITCKQRKLKPNNENKHSCDECGYKAMWPSDLNRHIESIHEGAKYPCEHCNFTATFKSNLQQHIKYVHEGFKHLCNQCTYKATNPSNLRRHKKGIHGE